MANDGWCFMMFLILRINGVLKLLSTCFAMSKMGTGEQCQAFLWILIHNTLHPARTKQWPVWHHIKTSAVGDAVSLCESVSLLPAAARWQRAYLELWHLKLCKTAMVLVHLHSSPPKWFPGISASQASLLAEADWDYVGMWLFSNGREHQSWGHIVCGQSPHLWTTDSDEPLSIVHNCWPLLIHTHHHHQPSITIINEPSITIMSHH